MPDLTRINQQIEKTKARLSELYAKRREIIAASKPPKPKRISSEEREQQIAALALAGATMQDIVAKVKLHRTTVRHYLWHAVWNAAYEELGDDASHADLEAKERELRPRLCPNIKWGKPWTAAQLKARYRLRESYVPYVRPRIMHRNSDGSIMGYFYSDGTPAPNPAEKA